MFPRFKLPASHLWRVGLGTVGHWSLAVACCLVFLGSARADYLVLRDLTLINNVTVTAFDEDGVRITNRGTITWDEIQEGSVRPELQADFDRLQQELGVPLFRIRQRLAVGDYAGLRQPADAVFPRYKDRESLQAYIVCQATMWGRLATGDPESAVEPYLYCLRYLRSHRDDANKLPGERRLAYDRQTGLTDDFLPIFFEKEKAAGALPQATAAASLLGGQTPDGVYVYLSALALAAHDFAEADAWRQRIRSGNPTLKEWPQLLAVQGQIQNNAHSLALSHLTHDQVHHLRAWNQPIGWYLAGVAAVHSDDQSLVERGLLDLLHVPALYGSTHAELAAAALEAAHAALLRIDQPERAAEIRRQLMLYYGGTWHAARLRAPSPRNSNS